MPAYARESFEQELELAAKGGLPALSKALNNYTPIEIPEFLIFLTATIKKHGLLQPEKIHTKKIANQDYRSAVIEIYEYLERLNDISEQAGEDETMSLPEDTMSFLQELDHANDIINARSIFDAEIKSCKNIKELFIQAAYDNFEIPFLSVLAYDPLHLIKCLKSIDVATRSNIAKRFFLLLRFPTRSWPAAIFSQTLAGICYILTCFTPQERITVLASLNHAFEVSERYDITDEGTLQSIAFFKQLIEECRPFLKSGLPTFITSLPKALANQILLLADDPEYLSVFQSFVHDLKFDDDQIQALVKCTGAHLEAQHFSTLLRILEILLRNKPSIHRNIINAIMSNSLAFAQISKYDALYITNNGDIVSRLAHLARPGFTEAAFTAAQFKFAKTSLELPATIPEHSLQQLTNGWQFVKFLHRTLLYVDPNDPQKMRALKIRKVDESVYALTKELHMLQHMHSKRAAYKLQSNLPAPVGVYMIRDLTDALRPSIIQPAADGKYFCYVYDATPAQFRYICDPNLSDAQFHSTLKAAYFDLIKMMLNDAVGMHQLIDLFHNSDTTRDDGGLYDPLIELNVGIPQGKLMAWMQQEHPNIRATGLADYGDYNILNNYSDIYQYLARYLFCLELIICFRARQQYDQATTTEQKNDIWHNAARTILGMHEFTLEKFMISHLGITPDIFVNLERLQNQLQYWLTTEYVQDFNQGRFRRWIYDDVDLVICSGSNTCPTVKMVPTWDPVVGFTSYKNATRLQQDVGPLAGPFPITELTKLRVATINIIANNFVATTIPVALQQRDYRIMLASARLRLNDNVSKVTHCSIAALTP